MPGSLPEAAGTISWKLGEYAFDESGNITTITNVGQRTSGGTTTGGVTEEYLYDSVDRLVSGTLNVAGGEPQTFEYDRYGNMTRKNGTSIVVDRRTNRLTGRTYDARGNDTGGGTTGSYVYDDLNMMTENVAAHAVFLYTADDERIAVIRNPGTAQSISWSIRDLSGKVLRDFTDSTVTDYVYRDGLLAATISGTEVRRYHLDHLGTPRLITDGQGVVKTFHHYFPYGEEAESTATSDQIRMKFTGHERDLLGAPETLDYMHGRYYSGGSGRLTSVDPITPSIALFLPQLWGRYSYTVDNPLNLVDPTGMETRCYASVDDRGVPQLICGGESETVTVAGDPDAPHWSPSDLIRRGNAAIQAEVDSFLLWGQTASGKVLSFRSNEWNFQLGVSGILALPVGTGGAFGIVVNTEGGLDNIGVYGTVSPFMVGLDASVSLAATAIPGPLSNVRNESLETAVGYGPVSVTYVTNRANSYNGYGVSGALAQSTAKYLPTGSGHVGPVYTGVVTLGDVVRAIPWIR